MILTPCALPKKHYKKTKLLVVLEEFMAMEAPCVRVNCTEYKTAEIGRVSINAAIKRHRMNTIRAIVRDGAVYLIRKDMIKEVDCK